MSSTAGWPAAAERSVQMTVVSQTEITVQVVPIDDLRPDPANPRGAFRLAICSQNG